MEYNIFKSKTFNNFNLVPKPIIKIIISYSGNFATLRLVNKKFYLLTEQSWHRKHWYLYSKTIIGVRKLIRLNVYKDIVARCLFSAAVFNKPKIIKYIETAFPEFKIATPYFYDQDIHDTDESEEKKIIIKECKYNADNHYKFGCSFSKIYIDFKYNIILTSIEKKWTNLISVSKLLFPEAMKDFEAYIIYHVNCGRVSFNMLKNLILRTEQTMKIGGNITYLYEAPLIKCKPVAMRYKTETIELINDLMKRGSGIVYELIFTWFDRKFEDIIKYENIITCIKTCPIISESVITFISSILKEFVKTEKQKINFIENIVCKYGNIDIKTWMLDIAEPAKYFRKIIAAMYTKNLRIEYYDISNLDYVKIEIQWILNNKPQLFGKVYDEKVKMSELKVPHDDTVAANVVYEIFKRTIESGAIYYDNKIYEIILDLYNCANNNNNCNLMFFLRQHIPYDCISDKIKTKNKNVLAALWSENYDCKFDHSYEQCSNIKNWLIYATHMSCCAELGYCDCDEDCFIFDSADDIDDPTIWFYEDAFEFDN